MANTIYALSALTAPSADPVQSHAVALDAATQTGVHFDQDGGVISAARMADGTGTATGVVKPDHDSD